LWSEAVLRWLSGADTAYSSDEMIGFSETRAGNSSVLLVIQGDQIAGSLLDLMGITSHRELPILEHLPGLADPSLLRNLLHIPGTPVDYA
jgi:hypothetical protein